jgi:hypothetical protein
MSLKHMSQPEQLLELELALEPLLWRFTGRWATSAVEPSDLSEPSGLAPSVSIKQTTAPTATASLFRFQCDNPTPSA